MDLVIDFKVVLNISGSAESFFLKQFGQNYQNMLNTVGRGKTVWYLKYLDAKRKTYLALGTNAVIFWKGHAKGNSFGLRHIFLDRVIEKIRCMDACTSSVFCIICVYVLLLKLLQRTQTHTHSNM